MLDCAKCVLISYHISIINANSITGEAADWYEAFKPVKQWKKQTKKPFYCLWPAQTLSL